jgi:hypothetical protein
MAQNCSSCKLDFPSGPPCCPHCGRPRLFPNVQAAEAPEERAALEVMYAHAMDSAAVRGADAVAQAFEARAARYSAVIGRPVGEVQRLATSDRELYATYYQFATAEIRIPAGERWDVLRRVTDEVLFPNYREGIRFAALSLDERGLSNYGACIMVVRDEMIAHRATVFTEITVRWMRRHLARIVEGDELPRGFRAPWQARARLAVVKVSDRLTASMDRGAFPALLLAEGADTSADEFIEVHIFGPITIRTVEKVVVQKPEEASAVVKLDALAKLLRRQGVPMEVVE